MKKALAAVLSALLALLCACGASAPAEDAAPVMAETTPAPSLTPAPSAQPAPDLARAYAKYPPETPVMTVDGCPVDWETYFGALSQRANFFWLYYGLSDYTAQLDEDGETVGDWIREQAEIDLRSMVMFRPWAEELGLSLTDGDYAAVEREIQDYADDWYGGDTAAMFEDLGASEAFTRSQGLYARLGDAVFAHFFGAEGEKLGDEEAVAVAVDRGYVYAKRILFLTVGQDGHQLTEAEKEEKRAEAEAALAELRSGPAGTLAERFDAMMRARSEDQGLEAYPDGYYFTAGELDAMYDAVLALETGELSGLVECGYGFQLIYRPEMDAGHIFETDGETGQPYTLRRWAAGILFNAIAEERYEAAAVEYAPGFEQLDIAALFA